MDEKLEKSLLNKIKSGEIEMKPKYFFTIAYSLLITGILGLFLVSSWFFNILLYKIRTQELWEYFSYGDAGFESFVYNIPFGAILVSLFCFIIGIILLKKFDLSYKQKFPVLVMVVAIVLICAAYLMDKNGLNKKLDTTHKLGNIYHHHLINSDWIIGSVIYRETSGFYVKNVNGRFFRAIPINSTMEIPIINRSDCIKIQGVITNEYVIKSYNYFKCPYSF